MCHVLRRNLLLPAEQIIQMQLSFLAHIQCDSFIFHLFILSVSRCDVLVGSKVSCAADAAVLKISASSLRFLGNKRRKKSREGEKSLEEGSEQPPVTS